MQQLRLVVGAQGRISVRGPPATLAPNSMVSPSAALTAGPPAVGAAVALAVEAGAAVGAESAVGAAGGAVAAALGTAGAVAGGPCEAATFRDAGSTVYSIL